LPYAPVILTGRSGKISLHHQNQFTMMQTQNYQHSTFFILNFPRPQKMISSLILSILFTIGATIIVLPVIAQGQNANPDTNATNNTKVPHHSLFPIRFAGNMLFPAISSSPETSLAFGVTGMRLYRTDSATRLSRISATAIYTLDKQYTIEGELLIYTPHNQWLLKGGADFGKFPAYFYGIGDKTQNQNKTLLSYQDYKADFAILKKLFAHAYLGAKLVYSNYSHVGAESGYAPLPGNLIGEDGGTTTGAGITAIFDNRDHPVSAHRGWYGEVSFISNAKSLGGDYKFTSFDADLRKFIPITTRSTLAFQAISSFKSGVVPFLQLSCLGSDDMMRGIYAGRYRDNDLVAAQVEFRQMIAPGWGIVLFAGEGKVGSDLNDLNNDQLQNSYGIGIRRVLSKNDRLNLRMDLGFGNGQANFYVNIGEAF
jgi:surface antigen Omp85-like protein